MSANNREGYIAVWIGKFNSVPQNPHVRQLENLIHKKSFNLILQENIGMIKHLILNLNRILD